MFLSTLPHGERPRTRGTCDVCSMFLSTLPHGERRADTHRTFLDLGVSIHAPARGATSAVKKSVKIGGVSIHAPARGATPAAWCSCHTSRCFYPRSRTGSD